MSFPFEIWGGLECTVNRVGDTWFDQVALTGHDARESDLDTLHALGFRTLRYPVLWERTARGGGFDWSFADRRLGRMRELGITPIVGLLHHGSGPDGTDLLDPRLPERFAEFAGAVARRYPWVELYTPINEPLTTARFACLYAHWYPHLRDERAFARAVVGQCRATALAMQSIRESAPGARLLQTEDLGKTHATPRLAAQARFENDRRWLSLDLLAGRVLPGHPAFRYLRSQGIRAAELEALSESPCVPDVLGVNHYLTSERFLDERLERYPASTHGGNGRQRYADVEAVRVDGGGGAGLRSLLVEIWERYGRPVAVTETQLAGPPEERIRWLRDVLDAARGAREAGADVVAVTAWSLFGAYDWDSLVTRADGHYEAGAFDVRAGEPRPTGVAGVLGDLLRRETPTHPAWSGEGWWRREGRLVYELSDCGTCPAPHAAAPAAGGLLARPILITGAGGGLGRALASACADRGWEVAAFTRRELDITRAGDVEKALDEIRPWAVVNAAGYVNVDGAETDEESCRLSNVTGALAVARACAARGIRLAGFSSDLVFDGRKDAPYVESDAVRPLCAYGRSKAAGERAILDALPSALVVRTSAFFGQGDEGNFVTRSLEALRRGDPFEVASDVVVSPTYVPDLTHAVLDFLVDGLSGVVHLASRGALTWEEFARKAARLARLPEDLLRPMPVARMGLRAVRPRQSALDSVVVPPLPPLEDALERCLRAAAG
jgi:dTDP-4-dehydrorhamnose reductase